jgi:AcrR family transcriptional regulator
VKTPPADLTRRLIAASGQIFDGQADIRLEDVATTVGVARTTLYYYFSGRDDLMSFLLSVHLKQGAEVIEKAADGAGTPAKKLYAVAAAIIQFLGEQPGLCTGLLTSFGASGRMEEVLSANETFIAAPVRDLVAAGIASGDVRKGDHSDITNALLGGILLVVLARSAQQQAMTSTVARRLADQILRGPFA